MADDPTIIIYNDPSSGEQDATIEPIVAALQKQVSVDFGPSWNVDAALHFVPSTEKPPTGVWVLAVLSTSDQAGALGYHDLTPDGLPLGKVFAATDRQYNQMLSVTISHELLEMLGDPFINLAAQADDGKFYAYETADAVEADNLGYQIDGVQVSDFVTRAWFGHGAGKVDHCGRVSAAFELAPGGYISVFDPASGQGWTQLTARAGGTTNAQELAYAVPRVGSRRERRSRKAAGGVWLPSTYQT